MTSITPGNANLPMPGKRPIEPETPAPRSSLKSHAIFAGAGAGITATVLTGLVSPILLEAKSESGGKAALKLGLGVGAAAAAAGAALGELILYGVHDARTPDTVKDYAAGIFNDTAEGADHVVRQDGTIWNGEIDTEKRFTDKFWKDIDPDGNERFTLDEFTQFIAAFDKDSSGDLSTEERKAYEDAYPTN